MPQLDSVLNPLMVNYGFFKGIFDKVKELAQVGMRLLLPFKLVLDLRE